MKVGVRFPLVPFYVHILKRFNLMLSQLNPNSWKIVVALCLLSAEHGIPLNYRIIKAFYTLVDREIPPFLLPRPKGLFIKLPYTQKS